MQSLKPILRHLATLFCCMSLSAPQAASADDTRILELADGSIISGRIISLENGVFTIASPTLGRLQVKGRQLLRTRLFRDRDGLTGIAHLLHGWCRFAGRHRQHSGKHQAFEKRWVTGELHLLLLLSALNGPNKVATTGARRQAIPGADALAGAC